MEEKRLGRAAAYFAAAEDQAWFWLSLSRRSAVTAAFMAEEQAAGEYVRVRR